MSGKTPWCFYSIGKSNQNTGGKIMQNIYGHTYMYEYTVYIQRHTHIHSLYIHISVWKKVVVARDHN